jgi:hypothetical protein
MSNQKGRRTQTALSAIALSLFALPALAEGVYMGTASTGEAVYYLGSAAQCGDLPADDECWSNPAVAYIIGEDEVYAVPDCEANTFSEVWLGDELVATNMTPESGAIQKVLDYACVRDLESAP